MDIKIFTKVKVYIDNKDILKENVVYKLTFPNGKIYIGFDSHNNPEYFGSGKLIKMALKKYGTSNFKKDIF